MSLLTQLYHIHTSEASPLRTASPDFMDTNLCLRANQKLAQGSGVPCGSLRLWDCPGPGGGCSPRGAERPPSLHTRSPPPPSRHHTSEAEGLGFSAAPESAPACPMCVPRSRGHIRPHSARMRPCPHPAHHPQADERAPRSSSGIPREDPAWLPSCSPQPLSQVLKLVLPAALRCGCPSLTSPAGPALFPEAGPCPPWTQPQGARHPGQPRPAAQAWHTVCPHSITGLFSLNGVRAAARPL